jgi:hypothetical protein
MVNISVVIGVPAMHEEEGYGTGVVGGWVGREASVEIGRDGGDGVFGGEDAGFDIGSEDGRGVAEITLDATVTVKETGIKLDIVENSTIVVVVGISSIIVVEIVAVVT